MFDVRSIVAAAKDMGAPKQHTATYTLDWASVAADTDDAEATKQIESQWFFIVEQLTFTAWRTTLDASMLAYTPLTAEPSPTEQSNTLESIVGLRLTLETSVVQLYKNVRVPNICGTARQPFILAQPFPVKPSETFTAKLSNDTGSAIGAQLCLIGRRVHPSMLTG